jgi:hypothetical protein
MSTSDQYSDFQYNLEYFSGAQANISIGSVLLDEVTTLQWNEHQSKVPIYGYASQYFDQIAKGVILVQGQFSINLIQPNYLLAIARASTSPNSDSSSESAEEVIIQRLRDAAQNSTSSATSPADIIGAVKILEGKTTAAQYFKYINDAIWGPSPQDKKRNLAIGDDIRVDNLPYFEIVVKYEGEPFGVNLSTHTLKDVCIIGSAKTLVIDEQPIQEVYSFYAKNVKNT